MRRSSRLILLLLCALPSAANALPQRTFVASNGADTNSCSLAAPCRSFGTAVAAVADHGEVIVLDSAGYGAVTITKSVSIIASPGVYAGISVFSGAGSTARVTVLRNQLQGNIYALRSTGAGASLILDGNAVTGNGTGIESLNGATIVTRGNNTVYSNGTDTLGTPYTSLGGI
jgi:hypothetical protein